MEMEFAFLGTFRDAPVTWISMELTVISVSFILKI
jgi:hypothetical protein